MQDLKAGALLYWMASFVHWRDGVFSHKIRIGSQHIISFPIFYFLTPAFLKYYCKKSVGFFLKTESGFKASDQF
jgi:hypothetical protein